MRRGVSVLEVVVAVMVLATVSVPLLEIFQGGLRTTRATMREIAGTNLAAEVAEQLETVPFDVLLREVETGPRTWSSIDRTLEDGREVSPESGWLFRLTAPPPGFTRELVAELVDLDLIHAEVRVTWIPRGRGPRTIRLRRALARDSLLPE